METDLVSSHQRIEVVGSRYSVLSRERLQQALMADAAAGRPGYVCVANVHTTMMGYFDPRYRQITNEAAYAVADGLPLVWAMKTLGLKAAERVRGPTLMRKIVNLGRPAGLKHYLYGGSPAALKALEESLTRAYPGCLIVGAESPPFRPLSEVSSGEWVSTANRINESGAHFVWVGLGAPKQERWMWEQRNRVHGVMLGVGAAFDLISGRIPEAPAAMQALGLEWAYRLSKEPRRLWRRYIFNNPIFLGLWFLQVVKARLFGKRFLSQGPRS